jgi:hypothetical protein
MHGAATQAAADRVRRGRSAPPAHGTANHGQRRTTMLYSIAVVLIILWLLGFVTSYTMGGIIHVLLVIAVVLILVQFIQGRRS